MARHRAPGRGRADRRPRREVHLRRVAGGARTSRGRLGRPRRAARRPGRDRSQEQRGFPRTCLRDPARGRHARVRQLAAFGRRDGRGARAGRAGGDRRRSRVHQPRRVGGAGSDPPGHHRRPARTGTAGSARLARRSDADRRGAAEAGAVGGRRASARAHERHDRQGQGDPAAARCAAGERRGLRARDRRPGRGLPASADPAAIPSRRVRPVHAGAADRRDGLRALRVQPARRDRRDRAGQDRVLHGGALADRHAGRRDPHGARPRTSPA